MINAGNRMFVAFAYRTSRNAEAIVNRHCAYFTVLFWMHEKSLRNATQRPLTNSHEFSRHGFEHNGSPSLRGNSRKTSAL